MQSGMKSMPCSAREGRNHNLIARDGTTQVNWDLQNDQGGRRPPPQFDFGPLHVARSQICQRARIRAEVDEQIFSSRKKKKKETLRRDSWDTRRRIVELDVLLCKS